MSQITASKPATTKAKEGFLQRFLDPIDRITEAIYAVLIVMTFTMAYRAIDASAFPTQPVSQLVTQLAIAAFGCAVAWGIIDGAMFILLSMLERHDLITGSEIEELITDARSWLPDAEPEPYVPPRNGAGAPVEDEIPF